MKHREIFFLNLFMLASIGCGSKKSSNTQGQGGSSDTGLSGCQAQADVKGTLAGQDLSFVDGYAWSDKLANNMNLTKFSLFAAKVDHASETSCSVLSYDGEFADKPSMRIVLSTLVGTTNTTATLVEGYSTYQSTFHTSGAKTDDPLIEQGTFMGALVGGRLQGKLSVQLTGEAPFEGSIDLPFKAE